MADRPNMVLLMTDMHVRSALGCYGNDVIKTPHIDSIAGSGVRCDRAYVQSPVCMPSRASVMTGRYVRSHGVHRNMMGLAPSEETVMQLLSDGGYHTAAAGKMHFMPKHGPFGNTYLDLVTGRRCAPHHYEDEYAAYLRSIGKEGLAYRPGGTGLFEPYCSRLPAEEHIENYIGGGAVHYLRKARREPFFLWVGFAGPHHPLDPPAPYDKMYDPDDVILPDTDARDTKEKRRIHTWWPPAPEEDSFRKSLAAYYGTISFIDFQIGRILRALADEGVSENTYVVFTTDHGMEFGHHGTLGHGFGSLYDEQVRAPLLVSGPDLPKGRISSAGIESIDLAPTFLELAGLPSGESMQGRSLVPVLRGEDTIGRNVTYSESCWLEDELRTGDGRLVYSTERKVMRLEYPWKYIHSTDEAHEELYDLDSDPGEMNNVVNLAEHRERVRSCKEGVLRWLAEGETSAAGVVDPIEDFTMYDPSPSMPEGGIEGVHYVTAEEREDLHG